MASLEASRAWKAKNREHLLAYYRAYNKRYYAKNKGALAVQKRKEWLHKKYKLTPETYRQLLDSQGGVCAICRRAFPKYVVDHDHKTNEVRGLLCDGCNVGIGRLGDDPEVVQRAAEYLRSHQACIHL